MRKRNIVRLLIAIAMIVIGLGSCESRPRQEIDFSTPAETPTVGNPNNGANAPNNDTATTPNNNAGSTNSTFTQQTTNDRNVPVHGNSGEVPADNNAGTEGNTETEPTPESENTDNPAAPENGVSGNASESGNANNPEVPTIPPAEPAAPEPSVETETRDSGTATTTPELLNPRQDAGASSSEEHGDDESTDAGFTGNTETHDAGNSNNNPIPPPPVLETPQDGVLVTASEQDVSRAVQREPENHPDVSTEVIANPSGLASATDNDGNVYSIRAFPKATTETLENWNARSYYGNSFVTNAPEYTANGYAAMLYSADDDGSFPAIHALIATTEFVYRIDWANPSIPTDFSTAIELLQEHREQYFVIPDHFKRFIRGLTVR